MQGNEARGSLKKQKNSEKTFDEIESRNSAINVICVLRRYAYVRQFLNATFKRNATDIRSSGGTE